MEYKDKQAVQETYNSNSKSNQIIGALPVTTFVSCKKNVSNTRTIATHVPSLPLSKPSSSQGGKHHHFLVRWPADFDPHGDALSTFKLSRLMKKESTGPSHNSPFGFGRTNTFEIHSPFSCSTGSITPFLRKFSTSLLTVSISSVANLPLKPSHHSLLKIQLSLFIHMLF